MSSPYALNVSSPLVISPSGSHQLVHIPFSPHLPSNLLSRNRSPLSNLVNLPVHSEIPRITGKARVLTSAACVHILKGNERKKQGEAEQKAKYLEDGSRRNSRRKKNCAVNGRND